MVKVCYIYSTVLLVCCASREKKLYSNINVLNMKIFHLFLSLKKTSSSKRQSETLLHTTVKKCFVYFFELIQKYTLPDLTASRYSLKIWKKLFLQLCWSHLFDAIESQACLTLWSHFETLHSFWSLVTFWKAFIFEYNILLHQKRLSCLAFRQSSHTLPR